MKAQTIVAALLLLGVTACAPSSQPATVGAILPAIHPGASPFQALLADSRDLGRLPGSRTVSFIAQLRARSGAGRAVAAMYRPGSKRFGRYASPGQWAKLAGPAPGPVARARWFLAARGVTFSWSRGQSWAVIRGTASAIERTFGVRIDRY
ncbi:MAG TPA: protease pro-enzyme activation domain-containing protein, partial [Chloroflexota bacterium]|nr:protease pro-enzyme activation domain-containing protein [Chloroflexota bacterium]